MIVALGLYCIEGYLEWYESRYISIERNQQTICFKGYVFNCEKVEYYEEEKDYWELEKEVIIENEYFSDEKLARISAVELYNNWLTDICILSDEDTNFSEKWLTNFINKRR